jgi:ribosome biogenesis GTPase
LSRRATSRRSREAASDAASLPSLDSLSDLPEFVDLVADDRQVGAFSDAAARVSREEGLDAGEFSPGCVVRLDRGFPAVVTRDGLLRAEHAQRLAKTDATRPAVGDWVVVRRPVGHDMGVIEEVLPRRSDLSRWRGGSRGESQTLAANVDVVLVAQQLSERPLSPDHIARSVVVSRDCGADAAVVLTKADRAGAEGLARDVACVRRVMGEDLVVVAVSSTGDVRETRRLEHAASSLRAGWGLGDVAALVGPGTVGIMLGESGAGKSTLLNGLLGHDVLRTGEVRGRDDAGRHTTVARRMVRLPSGGVIVDAPGLRSLPLVGHARGLMRTFPEIADAAQGCRFRDCTHTREPSCEVRAALARGEFTQERLDVYLALAAEMRTSASSLDPDVVL